MFDDHLTVSVGGRVTADDRTWPFMCVSILWVKESLQLLRRGRLNGLCNQLKSVIADVEVCHHALFYEFGRYGAAY